MPSQIGDKSFKPQMLRLIRPTELITALAPPLLAAAGDIDAIAALGGAVVLCLHGPAYTGISNARPATIALSKPPADLKSLPFNPLEFIEHLDQIPFDPSSEPGPGQ